MSHFAAALRTGRTSAGQWVEPSGGFAGGVFAEDAFVPPMPWKLAPTTGHLMGTLRGADGQPLEQQLRRRRADDRFDYGEPRFVTVGMLDSRLVVFVWTRRGAARRITSMRHCHEREAKRLRPYFSSDE